MGIRKVVAIIICLILVINNMAIYAKNTGTNNKYDGMYELKINTNNKNRRFNRNSTK